MVEQWSTRHSRSRRTPMLRTTAIGLVSILALGLSLASTEAAMSGRQSGGGTMHVANAAPGGMTTMRSNSSPGRIAEHDMGRMRMGEDHDRGRDRDHDRHDRDHIRFFPAFAFGINAYSDVYDPYYGGCWELHRVLSHGAWRLRR